MAKMSSSQAIPLIQYFVKDVKPAGSTTFPYHAYNFMSTFIVRTCSHSLEAASKWAVKGLFVSYDDIEKSARPNITIIYKMSCGSLLSIVLPKRSISALSSLFNILQSDKSGFKIHLGDWYKLNNIKSLVSKNGSILKPHFAKKASK